MIVRRVFVFVNASLLLLAVVACALLAVVVRDDHRKIRGLERASTSTSQLQREVTEDQAQITSLTSSNATAVSPTYVLGRLKNLEREINGDGNVLAPIGGLADVLQQLQLDVDGLQRTVECLRTAQSPDLC